MRIFAVSEFGKSFATRERGAEVRERLLDGLDQADAVVLDFTNVSFVTYSFADEFAGRLGETAPTVSFEVRNASPAVARILERAQSARAARC